jgi:hypothetical protein
MTKEILKILEAFQPGDLIAVDWFDASCGKSRSNGASIDVPVRSWGVYMGLMGVRTRQIVLAQNSFHYGGEVFDLDYTAIPLGWTVDVTCIQKGHLPKEIVEDLLRSFATGDNRKRTAGAGLTKPRIFQHKVPRRLSAYGRPH